MPWTVKSPPNPAKNKSLAKKRACVAAANAHIKRHPDDETGAIRACIGAMKNVGEFTMDKNPKTKAEFDALSFDDKLIIYYQSLGTDTDEADWSTAFKNNLPDISFAVIEKGGSKDSGGKTVPRNYRHLPHHGGISKHTPTNTDESHLKNAAARANQLVSVSPKDNTARIKSTAKSHLRSHYQAHGMDVPDNLKASAEDVSPLVENYSTDIAILEADDGNSVARARFKISEIEKRNRNGRVYPRDVWESQVQRFRRGTVTGQDGHPGFFSPAKVTDAFLIFDQLEIIGEDVFGEADVLDTQQGNDFVTVAKSGAKIAVSTRGFGSIERVDKWTDGKPAAIVQDDYKLLGVDVMFDGYQSVPTAKMRSLKQEAVSFIHESVNPQDYEKLLGEDEVEITVEYLNENYPDVVHELVHEHAHRVEELEAELETATTEKESAEAQVETLQAQLTEQAETLGAEQADLQGQLDVAKQEVADLNEKIETLVDERDKAQERAEAREYVFDKVVGEPAAWLMAKELLKFESVADVKANFPRVKRESERILASTPFAQGRSLHVQGETDQNGGAGAPEDDPEKARVLKWAGMAQ